MRTYVFASVGLGWNDPQLPHQLESAVDEPGAVYRLRPPHLESDRRRSTEVGRKGEEDALLQRLVVKEERVTGQVDSRLRRRQYVTDADYLTYKETRTSQVNEAKRTQTAASKSVS